MTLYRAMFITGLVLAVASLAAYLQGCTKTCAIIDIAHEACVVVTYADDAGVHTVRLTPEVAAKLGAP